MGWNWELLFYGIEQAKGQFKVLHEARPIEDLLADEHFPDSLKQKLLLVQEVREFAIDSLGLDDSGSYKKVYDQKGRAILWVVTACPPYALKAHTWKYPILGKLEYKGFFDRKKAEKEAAKLKKQGLDTEIDEVNAWSTLGIFDDPVLSKMLYHSKGELARLIIHELTHGTLFVKGNTEFNENLATFVGDHGALTFIKYKFGKASIEYQNLKGRLSDLEKHSKHILRGATRLDSLYHTFEKNMPTTAKDSLKQRMIDQIIQQVDTISFYNRSIFSYLDNPDFKANNTFFISFIMYRKDQDKLEQEFRKKFNADFEQYFNYLKKEYGRGV